MTNIALLGVIAAVVVNGSNAKGSNVGHALLSNADSVATKALDQLSSADIAVHLARITQLEETVSVVNQADSSSIELSITAADENIVAKPQIVSTGLKSRKDMFTYTTVEGDTVSDLAARFGITSDTIRWSNNIAGNTLVAGRELVISPVNGIVYTVLAGETPESIARKYRANKDQLIAFNDADLTGTFSVGEKIVIPGATPPAPVATANNYSAGFSFGSSAIYGYNGYFHGWCTWGVANLVRVPANWGNANTWDSGARASGWTVSPVPKVGAVAQTDRGFQGHVGVVTAVSEDGTMIKYTDMNGLAGFGRYGHSDWVPVHSRFENFIY